MKTLKEAMSDTIEMYEFIGQLRAENEALRKENALILTKDKEESGITVITATEAKMIKICKKIAAKDKFSSWNMPNVREDDGILSFADYYKRIQRDFIYSSSFDDIGLADIKEFFKEEIRDFYNKKIAEDKKEREEAGEGEEE